MSTYVDSFQYILNNLMNLKETDEEQVEKVARAILSGNNIFVYGVGRSGIVGRMFAMRLVQLGLKAYIIGETITPVVTKDDVVVIISGTGETQGAILVAQICRRVKAKIVSITSSESSTIYKAGDYSIVLKTNRSSDLAPLGTLFESSCHVLFDCMVARMMEIRGEKESDIRKRHAIWL
ncbi:MAG: SIS domain-containing protein [Thermoplasmatales archaeon]